ncbi:MAG: putative membrane protein [Spirosomataceae bacterium]|jgi:uncharacterized membrane protein
MKISKVTKSFLILSLLCSVLLFVRSYRTDFYLGFGLLWNLFLAWIPLFFALVARRLKGRRYTSLFFVGFWLLFFPNAPYIITDLVHLQYLDQQLWWYDSLGIFITAFTGLLIGVYSIQIVHNLLNSFYNRAVSWLLIFGSMLLSGFGIYLGRFSRLNSWDIISNPLYLVKICIRDLQNPLAMKTTLLFGFVLSVIYIAHYTLFNIEHELKKNVEKL